MLDARTREQAKNVHLNGRQATHFHAFKTLAERNGYRGRPGGYIKNDATGGTVAHGWQAFAYLVWSGNVPLTSERELDRAAFRHAWDAAPTAVRLHEFGRAAADYSLREDYPRALSFLAEAKSAVEKGTPEPVEPGVPRVLDKQGVRRTWGDIEPQKDDVVVIVREGRTSGREWIVKESDATTRRVKVDLLRGSVLGPQWENWSDVALARQADRVSNEARQ